MRKKKSFIIPILILIAVFFAIGYAYLTTTLTISGVTDIDRNSWDVYFDNIQVTDGSVTGSQVIDEAEITDDTTVEFHVNLKKPGDFYEFTIEARNDGTIDAMISSVSKKLNGIEVTTLPAYLNYTVTYQYDDEIEDNHLLAAESLETYKIRVEYRTDIEPEDLPSTAQSLDLSFGVEYVQADENAIEVEHVVFNISETYFSMHLIVGDSLPQGIDLYSNYQDAVNVFGHPFFIKYVIKSNVIEDAYVGFIYGGEIYYLHGGGGSGDGIYDSQYYESNKAVLQSAFGASNCGEYSYGGNEEVGYMCSDTALNINAGARKDGDVDAFDNEYLWSCIVAPDTQSGCSNIYG